MRSTVPYQTNQCSPAFEITGSGRQEDIVGVPVETQDGRSNGLLDVLANPPRKDGKYEVGGPFWSDPDPHRTHSPVILFLKIADGDEPRAAADGKLVLLG